MCIILYRCIYIDIFIYFSDIHNTMSSQKWLTRHSKYKNITKEAKDYFTHGKSVITMYREIWSVLCSSVETAQHGDLPVTLRMKNQGYLSENPTQDRLGSNPGRMHDWKYTRTRLHLYYDVNFLPNRK